MQGYIIVKEWPVNATLTLAAITLDCADPLELAAFYQRATGFALHPKSDDESGLTRDDGFAAATTS